MTIFLIIWASLSTIIGLLGLILLYGEEKLPALLSSVYKYGKLIDGSTGKLSPKSLTSSLVNLIQIPKRYFTHFYGFAIILHVAVVAMKLCLGDGCRKLVTFLQFIFDSEKYPYDGIDGRIFLTLCLIHFIRRFIETAYVAVPSAAKINLIHYLTGMAFYLSISLFNLNILLSPSVLSQGYPPLMTLGLLLFATGQIIQFESHKILANLRNKTDKQAKGRAKTSYYIPHGGLFEYVSSPNYLAELMIYTGLWLLTNFNRNWLGVLVWVWSNQAIAALLNHKWYEKTFKEKYPRQRKALIPFI